MSDSYLGEIKLFGGNYAPRDWMLCNGQILPISENTALYSLLGTYYGGDGRVTFGLPNLISRLPMGSGTGVGLTPRRLGSMLGNHQVNLNKNQLPQHSHKVFGMNENGNKNLPEATSVPAIVTKLYSNANPGNTTLDSNTLAVSGEGSAHENMMYTTAVSYIICVSGLYPPRN